MVFTTFCKYTDVIWSNGAFHCMMDQTWNLHLPSSDLWQKLERSPGSLKQYFEKLDRVGKDSIDHTSREQGHIDFRRQATKKNLRTFLGLVEYLFQTSRGAAAEA